MKRISILILTVAILNACGHPNTDPAQNVGDQPGNIPDSELPNPYPTFRGQDFVGDKNFANLINSYTEGKVEPTPWAGYWWPYTKNGIASGSFFGSESPAGKYDGARGRTTQAQAWEVKNHGAGVPKVQSWWGHCNGWTAASALFPEPRENVKVNGITFNVGDLKAILSELGMFATADFYGERTDVDNRNSPKYWDTVADQYFLVLTNYIGKLKQAVLIDRYTGSQVWNQPLAAYRFEYPKPSDYKGNSPEAPNIYKINLTSTIWWLDDGVAPDILTPPFSWDENSAVYHNRTLQMEVWLDGPVVFDAAGKITSSGNVVVTHDGNYYAGGAWLTDNGSESWPDYMWVPYSVIKPTDPEQDYANPEIDMNWVKAHLLVPGGADDPSVHPSPVVPAPQPMPSSNPSGTPFPWPTSTTIPRPTPTSTTTPSPEPTWTWPWPNTEASLR